MKVLVTGGAGYIGSHVVLELLDQGFDVSVLDDLSMGARENVDERAEFFLGSILNPEDNAKALEGVDAVIHMAAFKAAGESVENPEKYEKNNVGGTLTLLGSMLDHGIHRFVFSSSAAVYGDPQYLPVDEKHPVVPINPYGQTKLDIEGKLENSYSDRGIRFASLRYFNAAGYDILGRVRIPEAVPNNLLPIVMEAANGTRASLDVFGDDYETRDGTGVRDYIHVTDLAKAHILAVERLEKSSSFTINLGSEKGYSVQEVLDTARTVTGMPILANITGRRPGDPPKLVASSQKAKELLGWSTKHSDLESLISSMWEIYKPAEATF